MAKHRKHSSHQTPVAGTRASMQKISELPEKKHKKSARRSFMAMVRKARPSSDDFDIGVTVDDDDDDDDDSDYDGRPESLDDKVRKKEMKRVSILLQHLNVLRRILSLLIQGCLIIPLFLHRIASWSSLSTAVKKFWEEIVDFFKALKLIQRR